MICFGVISITGQYYTRRCNHCRYEETIKLPEIKKHIIYLDQFVISNIANYRNPKSDSFERVNEDRFWNILNEKLNFLSKAQLIICPDSRYHRMESARSKDYSSLLSLFKRLSNGTTVDGFEEVFRKQVYQHFKSLLSKGTYKPEELPRKFIISGRINDWREIYHPLIDLSRMDQIKDWLKEIREKREVSLKQIIEVWKSEKDTKLLDWARGFAKKYGLNIFLRWLYFAGIMNDITKGNRALQKGDENVIHQPEILIINAMIQAGTELKYENECLIEKIIKYLYSDKVFDVPCLQYKSLLWSSLRRKVLSGQKKYPTRGIFIDIDAISAILPYCDAVFIDKEIWAYLNEEPLKNKTKSLAKSFSLNNKDDFIDYLDSIKKGAGENHFDIVNSIYGPNYLKPSKKIITYS